MNVNMNTNMNMNMNYHDLCMKSMDKYVGIVTADGQTIDGFIAHADQNYVTLAIPSNEMMNQSDGWSGREADRAFGFYPGFFPRRRFYPYRIPYYAIASLFLLPFFI